MTETLTALEGGHVPDPAPLHAVSRRTDTPNHP